MIKSSNMDGWRNRSSILLVFVTFLLQVKQKMAGDILVPDDAKSSGVKDTLPVVYMSDHCKLWYTQYSSNNYFVYVDSSVVLELTQSPKTNYPIQCVVTFAARQSSQKLLIHFESMDINYNPGTIDRLHIFDGYQANYHNQLSPGRGLYGKYYKGVYEFSSGGIHDYTSSGPALTLYFEGSPSPAFNGFRAILTVFTDPHVNHTCGAGYKLCRLGNYCIPISLFCNGYANCGTGDKSDIQHCDNHPKIPNHNNYDRGVDYTSDLGLMVGCAISIVILMVLILWLGIVCLKRTKFGMGSGRRRLVQTNSVTDGPEEVEGAVVEPVQPRHFLSPILSFFEPPPLYSENMDSPGEASLNTPRYEPPPPYTNSVDDRDTARLICNESAQSRVVNSAEPQHAALPPSGHTRHHRHHTRGPVVEPLVRDETQTDTVVVAIATEAVENISNERVENSSAGSPPKDSSCSGAVSASSSPAEHTKEEEEKEADSLVHVDSGFPMQTHYASQMNTQLNLDSCPLADSVSSDTQTESRA